MVPDNQNNKIQKVENKEGQILQLEHFSGPLPHPAILEKYNQIVPGAADRIIKKFEAQTEHRHRIENRVIWVDSVKSILGLIFAFLIAMTAIVGGLYSVLHGYSFLGGSLSFAGLAILVAGFITNRFVGNKKPEA